MASSDTDKFDPYYKWLGIPPEQQPPDHYRLLGLKLFEGDREVIAIAADRQMSHVKTFAVGKYGQLSQSLLDELAKAKLCLLNAGKKSAYDAGLKNQISSTAVAAPVEKNTIPARETSDQAYPVAGLFDEDADTEFAGLGQPKKTDVIYINPAHRGRRKKRPTRNLMFGWYLIAVCLAGAGLVMLNFNARQEQSRPETKVVQSFSRRDPQPSQKLDIPRRQWQQPRQRPRDKSNPPRKQRDELPVETLPKEQSQELPKLNGLPAIVDLPDASDLTISDLYKVPTGTKLEIVPSDSALSLSDNRLEWLQKGEKIRRLVAGLAVNEGQIQFGWVDEVPIEAETALRNSLLQITFGKEVHRTALRATMLGEPFRFNLTDNKFILKSPAEYPPPVEAVCFEFLGRKMLPPHAVEEGSPSEMAVGDACTLVYDGPVNAWTTISMEKTGKVAAVEFRSMYELPSGRQIPMSIKNGNAERRAIENELRNVQKAKNELQQLEQNRPRVQDELNKAIRRNHIILRDQFQAQLINIDARTNVLKAIIADEPHIKADLNEQIIVTGVAQQLHQTQELPYRFYMLIEDTEVDLFRSDVSAKQ